MASVSEETKTLMTNVIMPKMGDGMEEGTLLNWIKKDGDTVKSGEVIGNIQTDKATLELEAPAKGVLTGFLINEGDTVPVGRPIAAILKAGETLPENWGSGGEVQKAAPKEESVAEKAPEQTASSTEPTQTSSTGRIMASPVARKLAAEKGIDLSHVTGTGPGGRIVKADVESAKSMSVAPSFFTNVAAKDDEKIKLNRLRGIIADRTSHSFQHVPHIFLTVEVDLEKIETLRDAFKMEDAGKISINDFIVKASVRALEEMPVVNSSFQGDHLLQYGSINIGIAAAIEDGLVVPVIHNAHAMTLRELAFASKDLVSKARENKLKPEEMQGSTFSISNMGMLDIDNFTAIINEPNSAILAVSSARRKVVVGEDDEVEIRTRMNITCSFDHRVVDGAIGAQFINKIKFYLENPMHLVS